MGDSLPKVYAVATLGYQILLLMILNIFNISMVRSQHIKTFLKIYIPVIMIGKTVLLLLLRRKHTWPKQKISEFKLILSSILAFAVGSVVYHSIAVLLGAAFFEAVEESFLFSSLCSALTVFPLYLIHGTKWEDFVDSLPDTLDVSNQLSDAVKMVSFFTLFGAWVGAFPIPLDWDREWQTWPITCCVSAIGGNIFGTMVVLWVCTRKVKLW